MKATMMVYLKKSCHATHVSSSSIAMLRGAYSVGYFVASAYPFLPGSVVARHLSKLNPGRAFQNAVPLLYCGVGGCLRFELDST